jgi:hypothetical protein
MHFDDGTPESEDWVFDFGSATALEEIRVWVKAKLPADECPRLHELVDTLATKNTMELGAELEVALDVVPPPSQVLPILANLLDKIGVGDEDETVTIGTDFPQSKADREACESALAGDDQDAESE